MRSLNRAGSIFRLHEPFGGKTREFQRIQDVRQLLHEHGWGNVVMEPRYTYWQKNAGRYITMFFVKSGSNIIACMYEYAPASMNVVCPTLCEIDALYVQDEGEPSEG